jgi:hypothetical protein
MLSSIDATGQKGGLSLRQAARDHGPCNLAAPLASRHRGYYSPGAPNCGQGQLAADGRGDDSRPALREVRQPPIVGGTKDRNLGKPGKLIRTRTSIGKQHADPWWTVSGYEYGSHLAAGVTLTEAAQFSFDLTGICGNQCQAVAEMCPLEVGGRRKRPDVDIGTRCERIGITGSKRHQRFTRLR